LDAKISAGLDWRAMSYLPGEYFSNARTSAITIRIIIAPRAETMIWFAEALAPMVRAFWKLRETAGDSSCRAARS